MEVLANELLLELFEYLPTIDLLHAFDGLNSRFNTLLFTHFERYYLDCRSMSKRYCDTVCERYLPLISNRVLSLSLSDEDETPHQINYFLSHGLILHQLTNLRSLRLYYLRSIGLMNILMVECQQLPYLTHLDLIECSFENEQLNNIWSLSKLNHCHLDIFLDRQIYGISPSVISMSLQNLSIDSYCYGQNKLGRLLQNTPYLRRLSVLLRDDPEDQPFSFIISSIIILKLSVYESSTTMTNLLKNTPNLRHLTIKTDALNMNGYDWERLIVDYLPKLQIFVLKMIFRLNDNDDKEQRVDDLLNSFRTRFWLIERLWYIRCDWNRCEQCDKNNIYLYTLPYAFDDYFFHDPNFKSKSSHDADNDYSSYDHVHSLGYELIPTSNQILPFNRFSNLYHLDLCLPFDKNFFTMIPEFDQLVSLQVAPYHPNDDFDCQGQLQTLLDRAPRLNLLTFKNWSSSCEEMPPYQYSNKSIRKLHLQDVDRWYNSEQCARLSQLPLGSQCEVLSISVQNRTNILDLIQMMTNLRAMNVICQDDIYEINNSNPSSTDELVHWLGQRLSSACMITRHDESIQNNQQISFRAVQLWIR